MNQNPESNTVREEKLTWFKSSSQYRTLDTIDGEPMEFEWNIFPGFTTLQLCNKVQEFMSKISDPPEQFKGRITTIETVFRTTISVNQIRIYGAVSDLCEEYKACQVRTGRPVLAGQSDPLFEPASLLMETPTNSTEDPVQEDLSQKYKERVERLSQQNRVI